MAAGLDYWQIATLAILVFGGTAMFIMYSMVKSSVGWGFVKAIAQAKQNTSKGYGVLRVKHLVGNEEYVAKKFTQDIEYNSMVNGRNVKCSVLWDGKAQGSFNGVPMLEVSPLDIRPINAHTGYLCNIPSEFLKKHQTDSIKTAESDKEQKDLVKYVVWGSLGAGLLMLMIFAYMQGEVGTTNEALRACYQKLGESANIIVGE